MENEQPAPAPIDPWLAHLFGALYGILAHQVAADLFPGTRLSTLSTAQDGMVTARTDALIRFGAERILPKPPQE